MDTKNLSPSELAAFKWLVFLLDESESKLGVKLKLNDIAPYTGKTIFLRVIEKFPEFQNFTVEPCRDEPGDHIWVYFKDKGLI